MRRTWGWRVRRRAQWSYWGYSLSRQSLWVCINARMRLVHLEWIDVFESWKRHLQMKSTVNTQRWKEGTLGFKRLLTLSPKRYSVLASKVNRYHHSIKSTVFPSLGRREIILLIWLSNTCKSETRCLLNCGRRRARALDQVSPSAAKIPSPINYTSYQCVGEGVVRIPNVHGTMVLFRNLRIASRGSLWCFRDPGLRWLSRQGYTATINYSMKWRTWYVGPFLAKLSWKYSTDWCLMSFYRQQ